MISAPPHAVRRSGDAANTSDHCSSPTRVEWMVIDQLRWRIALRSRRRPGTVAMQSVAERHSGTASADELVGPAHEVTVELLQPAGPVSRVFAALDGGHGRSQATRPALSTIRARSAGGNYPCPF